MSEDSRPEAFEALRAHWARPEHARERTWGDIQRTLKHQRYDWLEPLCEEPAGEPERGAHRRPWTWGLSVAAAVVLLVGGGWMLRGQWMERNVATSGPGVGGGMSALDAARSTDRTGRWASGRRATRPAGVEPGGAPSGAPLELEPEPESELESEPESDLEPERPPKSKPRRRTRRTTNHGTLAEEMTLMRQASAALRAGDAARARARLREHARLFPRGQMRSEGAALELAARCILGRTPQTRTAARRYVTRHAGSPYADRVRRACESEP